MYVEKQSPGRRTVGTSIQTFGLDSFYQQTDNLYYAVVVLGKRANQIGAKMKAELQERLAEFGPAGDSLEEIVENREQIEIAKIYEQLPKPTLLAIEEYINYEIAHRNETELYRL